MNYLADLNLTLAIEARDREEAQRIAELRRREIEAAFPARAATGFTPAPADHGPFRHAPCVNPPPGYPQDRPWIGP